MTITADQQAAITRLGQYNTGEYDPTGNPYGLSGEGGLDANFDRLWRDTQTVANYLGSLVNDINFIAARAEVTAAMAQAKTYRDQAGAIALAPGSPLLAVATATMGVGVRPLHLPRNTDLPPSAAPDRATRWGLEVAASLTLTPTAHRGVRLWATTAGITITLPGAADPDMDAGWDIEVANSAGGSITIARAGADTINAGSSITVAAGARVIVQRLAAFTFRSI